MLNPNAKEWTPSWLKKPSETTTPVTTNPIPEKPIETKEKPINPIPPAPVANISKETIVETIETPADILKEEELETPVEEEDIVIENADPREHINVVFIGHVDAGKSTLSGNILYLTGQVDKRTIEKYEREAVERGRESWFLAFIMDTNEEEREKGKTVDVGRAHFETENKRFTILDAPGHKSYVPNMIVGATQADVAVLLISARKGEFEAGFEKGGQTREHAMLAKTLGIKKIVIVINKMDEATVKWNKTRYEQIVVKLAEYFKNLGYRSDDLVFLPISAITGANVIEPLKPEVCSWFKGKSLIQVLDSIEIEGRNPRGPVRMPIMDKYFDRGICLVGKVESGIIKMNDKLMIVPGKIPVEVTLIEVDDKAVNQAQPGDNIDIYVKGTTEEHVHRGYMLCSRSSICPVVKRIEALLMVLEIPTLFSAGYEAVLHIHTAIVECTVLKLLETKEKDKVVKHPVFVKSNSKVKVLISLAQAIPLDTFASLQAIGRFSLRNEGMTIGVGKILRAIE